MDGVCYSDFNSDGSYPNVGIDSNEENSFDGNTPGKDLAQIRITPQKVKNYDAKVNNGLNCQEKKIEIRKGRGSKNENNPTLKQGFANAILGISENQVKSPPPDLKDISDIKAV